MAGYGGSTDWNGAVSGSEADIFANKERMKIDNTWRKNMSDRNIKITLQYDGSRYDGWQKQGNTDKPLNRSRLISLSWQWKDNNMRKAQARVRLLSSCGLPKAM